MLNVVNRDLNEKAKYIVKRGYIPAIIYGTNLERSIPIELYSTDFKRLIEVNGHKGCIELNLDGDVKNCVITNVQIDGIKEKFLHIDFKLVD